MSMMTPLDVRTMLLDIADQIAAVPTGRRDEVVATFVHQSNLLGTDLQQGLYYDLLTERTRTVDIARRFSRSRQHVRQGILAFAERHKRSVPRAPSAPMIAGEVVRFPPRQP